MEKIILHGKGNVLNFLDHELEDGYIPMMIEVADNEEPYLNKKHKEGVLPQMEKIEKYITYYRKTYYFEDKGLFVWCDDIMIGMDNDPASFGRPKFSTANIFLNAFMVMELEAYGRLLKLAGSTREKTGCLHEYYNPFAGTPVMNGGFINWNVLALSMAKEIEKEDVHEKKSEKSF